LTKPSVFHSTFALERSFAKSPERVFAAFSDESLKRRWFADGEHHEIEEFHMDFKLGGAERLRYRFNEGTPFAGTVLVHQGSFVDIVPDHRIVSASSMAFGDTPISASLVTFEFLSGSGGGTDLVCTHQGAFFEGSDGPQIREQGWQKLLDRLQTALAVA
jgi:uncharacterized protein YndB with AHSA1/START domain